MVKRIAAILLAAITALGCMGAAFADVISVDPDTASYDEIVDAIQQLTAVRNEMLLQQYAATRIIEPKEGIVFRGVSWHTAKREAEAAFGGSADYVYGSVSTTEGHNRGVSGGYGLEAWYRQDASVAGYSVSLTKISYVYPVVDGLLLRDDDSAILYMGYYRIGDLGDVGSAVNDLSTKLSGLYGSSSFVDSRYIWSDEKGNTIALWPLTDSIVIKYWAYDTDELIAQAKLAVANERAEQEALQRLQNPNNTDGL